MEKWFIIGLASLAMLWGVLFAIDPDGWQRDICSRDKTSYFTDFILPRQCLDLADRYDVSANSIAYGHFALEMLRPFSCDRRGAVVHMAISGALFLLALTYFAIAAGMTKTQAVLLSAAFSVSWIFLRTIERGNTIFWVAAMICLFFAWFDSKTTWKRALAAICLGLSAMLKICPAFLGLLYFLEPLEDPSGRRKIDWLSIVLSAAVGASTFLLPFFIAGNGIADIQNWMAVAEREGRWHLSAWGLYGSCCALNLLVHHGVVPLDIKVVAPLEMWHCKALTALVGFIPFSALIWFSTGIRRCLATRSDRMFLAIATMLVWCMNSMFYVGLFFFPVIILWFQETKQGKSGKDVLFELAMWLLMLMPVQIVAFGKPMSLTITFATFWLIILTRIFRCFRRSLKVETATTTLKP